MNRTNLLNLAGLLGALAATVAVAERAPRGSSWRTEGNAPRAANHRIRLPDGTEAVIDRGGVPVPVRPYRRIVSTSLLTDRLLVELCEPDRVLAFSHTGARTSPWAFQYAGKMEVDGLGPLETVISLKPDLVLVNTFGGGERARKLRSAGVAVFDLGELRGLSTLGPSMELLADLLGHPERAARFLTGFAQRLQRVADPLGSRPRRRGLYLATIGTQLYGGARGTSYHDVLTHGGLLDVAAGRFENWPVYSTEAVLQMAPQVVVTREGLGASLCSHPGLAALPACHDPHGIIELPAGLLDEPGPAILDAAEMLFARAYPELAEHPAPW